MQQDMDSILEKYNYAQEAEKVLKEKAQAAEVEAHEYNMQLTPLAYQVTEDERTIDYVMGLWAHHNALINQQAAEI